MKNQTIKISVMKNILQLLLLFSGVAFGQIVNIPDPVFKAKLIELGIDSNLDGEIQNSEASATSIIYLHTLPAINLSGIEAFTNLDILQIDTCSQILIPEQISLLTSLSILILRNCNLGYLDVSSLINLRQLDINYNYISNLNLAQLVNLNQLLFANNFLTNLNLPNNILEELDMSGNQFSSINLNQFPFLKKLNISNNNNLTNVPIANLLNLEVLNTTNLQNNIVSLSNLPSLKDFTCQSNDFTTLDLSPFPSLVKVNCSANDMTSLNLNGLINLQELRCNFNNLTSLDLSSLTNLLELYCEDNLLTTLNILPIQNAFKVSCFGNLMTTIDVSGNNNLKILSCGGINFNALDVTNLNTLLALEIKKSSQTSLDLSNSVVHSIFLNETNITSLEIPIMYDFMQSQNYVALTNNQNLVSLNIKNGMFQNLILNNCPNLIYVCEDQEGLDNIISILNFSTGNNPNVQVSTYCSFVPGGNYNTITGKVTLDTDNNGCDANDLVLQNTKMKMTQWSDASFTFTNPIYKFYTVIADQSVEPILENSTYFNISPQSANVSFPETNSLTATQDFCLTANGVHNDLEIVLMPIGPARPGFDTNYKIVYKNKGNLTLSGDLNLTFDDAVLDYISSSIAPNSQVLNNLTWNYSTLLPFETRTILVTLNVNSPLETPAVNLGDNLNFITTINPITGDDLPLDNTFTYNQTVVGSFDPNDIMCLEGENVSPSEIGNYLHYAVQFENTGTYLAENVVVKVVIDTNKYDLNTIQLLNTSNPAYTRITGNVIEFIFETINLSAAIGNPPVGGHGDILFKIKSKNNLVNGDFVSKKANIYFDYNAPIETIPFQTTFQALQNSIFNLDTSISVFPNPTNSIININCKNTITSLELYDVQGRLLETSIENNTSTTIDISSKQNGIYFLKITSEKGSSVEKIIRE